jgi:hypothetical protein
VAAIIDRNSGIVVARSGHIVDPVIPRLKLPNAGVITTRDYCDPGVLSLRRAGGRVDGQSWVRSAPGAARPGVDRGARVKSGHPVRIVSNDCLAGGRLGLVRRSEQREPVT